jgi:uncharacterized membrane protein (UPF0127 family)
MAWNRFKKISLRLVFLVLIIGLIFYLFTVFSSKREEMAPYVIVNEKKISVEIARDFSSQYRGLSGRDSLCATCGMLFVFPSKQELEFVMRDMKFPLDIIFISSGRVINIFEKLKPEGAQPTNFYKSAGVADQVLELNGGDVEKYKIKVGTEVKLIN